MRPWLIQSGEFKSGETRINENHKLDDIIAFDYMGYAEFEFGNLGRAFREMASEYKDLVIIPTGLKDHKRRELFVMCHRDKRNDVVQCVKHIAHNPYGYKAYCNMGFVLGTVENKVSHSSSLQDMKKLGVWFDLDNLWIACTTKDRMLKVQHALKNLYIETEVMEANHDKSRSIQ